MADPYHEWVVLAHTSDLLQEGRPWDSPVSYTRPRSPPARKLQLICHQDQFCTAEALLFTATKTELAA